MSRRGYDDEVGVNRALAKSPDPADDLSPIIQELIARLNFMVSLTPIDGMRILDYGCGAGLTLQWLHLHSQPGDMLGLNVSHGAISFAKRTYPNLNFSVVNIEQPDLSIDQKYDLAICFEVLEHLSTPSKTLETLSSLFVKTSGHIFVSTPNRLVFFGGYEPSPINRTHIHEMDLTEFDALLKNHFQSVQIWGMKFRDESNSLDYQANVRHSISGYRLLGDVWWNPWVNRFYRWILRGDIFKHIIPGRNFLQWKAADFEFITERQKIQNQAIWFFCPSLPT